MSEVKEYQCPSCGGALEFNAQLQKLKCPFCDSEFDVRTLDEVNETADKVSAEDRMDSWQISTDGTWSGEDEKKVCSYICKSCGGEIIADITTGATACPYCGNNVVINEKFAKDLKPDLVIPFKLDKKAAKEALSEHLSGKKLLPKLFKSQAHLDEVRGIYVPFWLYNADVDGAASYSATTVRHWSSGSYDYTETKYFDVYREGGVSFRNIPVDGSSKMADDLMDSLEPFDLSEAVDFNTAYLAGYLADKYDVTAEDNIPRINTRVKASTENVFRSTVDAPYTTLSVKNSFIDLKNGSARYALLPVWILNTTWNGQRYVFAMNGQTGKFIGNLPMDKGLYWKHWFLTLLTYLPIGLAIGYLVRRLFY